MTRVDKILQSIHKKYYEGKKNILYFNAKEEKLKPILKGTKSIELMKKFKEITHSNPEKYNKVWIGHVYIGLNMDKKSMTIQIALSPYNKYGNKDVTATILQDIKFIEEDFLELGGLTYPKIMQMCQHMFHLGYKNFKKMGSIRYSDFLEMKK